METASHLVEARRKLHSNPELSGQERETQAFIQSFLSEHIGRAGQSVGQYGVLLDFDFGDGPSVLVRVDTDALPIQEINDFAHKSSVEGVSHKCGHDGHTTIGLGLAERLHSEPLAQGKVSILFQPAEEIGEGAKGILADASFDIHAYDMAVALHNIPGKPMHQLLYRTESFTPAVHSLIVKLQGKTSHAAEPLKGNNPSYAIADIIAYAKANEQTDETHADYHLLTPVHVSIGSKDYGISAGYGEVHFTIRSWTQDAMEEATDRLKAYIDQRASEDHLSVSYELTAAFAANKNDTQVVKHITYAGEALGVSMHEKDEPFPWGEDFGLFTQQIPGAMFGLGSGEDTPALHNPDYDYPDEITATGIALFYETVKSAVNDV
jgi:amidohydrolase